MPLRRAQAIARFLFALFAGVSAFLCSAAIFASFTNPPPYGGWTIFQPVSAPRPYTKADEARYNLPEPDVKFAGFLVQRTYRATSDWTDGRLFIIPWWFFAVLFAMPPLLWFRSFSRRATWAWRSTHGLCPRCGYDLRATPGACPECGYSAGT